MYTTIYEIDVEPRLHSKILDKLQHEIKKDPFCDKNIDVYSMSPAILMAQYNFFYR